MTRRQHVGTSLAAAQTYTPHHGQVGQQQEGFQIILRCEEGEEEEGAV